MKTLSIPATVSGRTAALPAFPVIDSVIPRSRAPLDWLPAPAEPRRPLPARPAARCLWLTPPRTTTGERVMLVLITLAAIAGIGYGLVCMLNLVENWAAFHAGVATLVQ